MQSLRPPRGAHRGHVVVQPYVWATAVVSTTLRLTRFETWLSGANQDGCWPRITGVMGREIPATIISDQARQPWISVAILDDLLQHTVHAVIAAQ